MIPRRSLLSTIRPLPIVLGLALATWPAASSREGGSIPDGSAAGPRVEAPADGSAAELDLLEHLERRVAEVAAEVRDSAVTLEYTVPDVAEGGRRVATGVILNDRGEVLSVNIDPPPDPARPVLARDASGHSHPTHWLAADPATGLTLLRVDAEADHFRPIRAIARAAALGTTALVIGSPFGLDHSVKRGNVAGLNRRLDLGERSLGGLIQVEAMLHPGDSGALLANLQGEWLGLIRSGLASGSEVGAPGLGFAIPAADAVWVADQLRAGQRVDRAYLGVKFDRKSDGAPGAVLSEVLPDSPASRAGMQPGDRVEALGGHPIRVPTDLIDRLDRTLADTRLPVEVLRGPDRLPLTVHTAPRPPGDPPAPRPRSLVKPDPAPDPVAAGRLDQIERRLQDLERIERRIQELERREAEVAERMGEGRR